MDARVVEDALGAQVTAVPIEGGTRFYVTRGECSAKFDLVGDTINWVSLQSPGEGWLDDAVEFVTTVAPEYGVRQVKAEQQGPRSGDTLRRRGFEGEGVLTLRV